ncbi:ribbon-helix-helix protein, CopG family [Candidatus Woesearchaeota archaeon]|nr:ribbon-helix-helix protein, CopG family [Candidatus Woesearchaeota archaeon]
MVNRFRKRYINISIPEELVQEIDALVMRSHLGYKNRAELVKEAIRNHLRRIAVEETSRLNVVASPVDTILYGTLPRKGL